MRVICVLVLLSIMTELLSFAVSAKLGDEHDDDLKKAFFGTNLSRFSSEYEDSFQILSDGAYLCIDQFNHQGKDRFDRLKKSARPWLAGTEVEDIDFNASGSGTSSHRSKTHKGWEGGDEKANWALRQKILRLAVNDVFGFCSTRKAIGGKNAKVESMCELIFCIHVLGDHVEDLEIAQKKIDSGQADGSVYKLKDYKLEIAGRHDKHDIVDRILECIEVLFSDQKRSHEYTTLVRDLKDINNQAGEMVNSLYGVYNEEYYIKYESLASDVLVILEKRLPGLLKNEEYFTDAFPEK